MSQLSRLGRSCERQGKQAEVVERRCAMCGGAYAVAQSRKGHEHWVVMKSRDIALVAQSRHQQLGPPATAHPDITGEGTSPPPPQPASVSKNALPGLPRLVLANTRKLGSCLAHCIVALSSHTGRHCLSRYVGAITQCKFRAPSSLTSNAKYIASYAGPRQPTTSSIVDLS